MDEDIRVLITNIKAAVRLGHIEAVQVALDGLLELPDIAANSPLTTAFIQQAVLPIAQVLALSPISVDQLIPLGSSNYAACRAIFGALCATRFFKNTPIQEELMTKIANDARQDVRAAFIMAFSKAGMQESDLLTGLAAKWARSAAPRLKAVGLSLLAHAPAEALAVVLSFDPQEDTELLAAMADLLTSVAQGGYTGQVYSLLSGWAAEAEKYSWVICKTLSEPWAAVSPQTAIKILNDLVSNGGSHKQVKHALQALARYDTSGMVNTELEGWT